MEMTSENQEDGQINSALLTKGEIEWLQRKRSDSTSSRAIKSRLLKKLRQFQSYELPLLVSTGLWDKAAADSAPAGFVWIESVGEQSAADDSVVVQDRNSHTQEVLSRRRSRVQWNARLALDPNKSRPEHSF